MSTAVTIGKFDGFHNGHRLLLKSISDYASKNDAEAVCYRLESGSPSILSVKEQEGLLDREFGIKRIERIHFTPEFAALTPEEFVAQELCERLDTKFLAVGVDFRFGRNREGDIELLAKLCDRYGITLNAVEKLVLDEEVVSSTRIRNLLSEGKVDEASGLLGDDYCLRGIVLPGKKLGRTLGFPTINIVPGEDKLLPRYGVYASRTMINDGKACKTYSSITNIGVRPTAETEGRPNAETFIYDYSGDLYGADVTVKLGFFIRPEKRFDSLDQLTEQIRLDIKQCLV